MYRSERSSAHWFRRHHPCRSWLSRARGLGSSALVSHQEREAVQGNGPSASTICCSLCCYVILPQVAALSAKELNPSVQISPIRADITDPEFDVTWFRRFNIVLNGLQSTCMFFTCLYVMHQWSHHTLKLIYQLPVCNCICPDARRHMNKMCLAAAIPFVDSETVGDVGHVQPILKVAFLHPEALLMVLLTSLNCFLESYGVF